MIRAIGVGDNVVDRYVNKNLMFPGGNTVNFSAFVKQCGAESAYLGVIGDDKEGRLIHEALTELGVDLSHSPMRQGLATERCDVVLDEGDRVFVGCSYGEGEREVLKINPEIIQYLDSFDIVHSSCYSELEREIAKLAGLHAFKTFDFSSEIEYRQKEYLEKICPYIDMALFSAEKMSNSQEQDLRDLVISMGTKYVLITKGIQGQSLWDGKNLYQGTVKLIKPVDTMGAGDSFFTSFVISLFKNGFQKGRPLTKDQIRKSFEAAADFSANNCLVEGAFGFATKYE